MSRDDRNAKPGHALCGYSVSDVGMAKGGKQSKPQQDVQRYPIEEKNVLIV